MFSNEYFFPPSLFHKKDNSSIYDPIIQQKKQLLPAEDLDDTSMSTDTIPKYLKSIEETS